MAIALQTIIDSESPKISREQEPVRLTRLAFFDPDKIVTITDDRYKPPIFTERSTSTPEVLVLHNELTQVIGLLANSTGLDKLMGQNQIVEMHELGNALNTTPKIPISLDIFDIGDDQKVPPLLLIGMRKGELIPLLTISLEFLPPPKVLTSYKETGRINLRPKRVAERMDPV